MPRISPQQAAALAAEKLQQANEAQQKIAENALAAIENGVEPEVALFIAEEAAKTEPVVVTSKVNDALPKSGNLIKMKFVFSGDVFNSGTYNMCDDTYGGFNIYADNKGEFLIDEVYVENLLSSKEFVRID